MPAQAHLHNKKYCELVPTRCSRPELPAVRTPLLWRLSGQVRGQRLPCKATTQTSELNREWHDSMSLECLNRLTSGLSLFLQAELAARRAAAAGPDRQRPDTLPLAPSAPVWMRVKGLWMQQEWDPSTSRMRLTPAKPDMVEELEKRWAPRCFWCALSQHSVSTLLELAKSGGQKSINWAPSKNYHASFRCQEVLG